MRRLAVPAVAALLLLGGGSAAAQDTGWTIDSFDVTVLVHEDGALAVTEVIEVDFGALQRRGILRNIPVRSLTDDPEVLRAIDISNIRVSSTAPDDVDLTRPAPTHGTDLVIRIGDPDVYVTGPQRYEIRYDVRGAMSSYPEHSELYWNATGDGWPVPILRATLLVSGPQITKTACFRGPRGSTRFCDSLDTGPDSALFRADGLGPEEGLTAAVGFAPGSVDVPPPILMPRWTLRRGLMGGAAAVPLTVLTGLVGLGGVGTLAYRQGRDRVSRGGVTVDGHVDTTEQARRRRLLEPRPVTPAYRPPENLRPGQLGVLVDERVDPVDISATIVDLAVRGHLRIEERRTRRLLVTRTDWRLHRTPHDDPLLAYEKRLLSGLFGRKKQVDVSDLKGSFAEDYKAVSTALYQDVVDNGWFPVRPDRVRSVWIAIGVVLAGAAIVLFVAAMLYSTVALAVLPLVLAGWALAVLGRWMPHRTPQGSRLLVQTLGFREFIRTAEAGPMDFAEQEQIFARYLPYAVVFGAVDRWAARFSHLAAMPTETTVTWYSGTGGLGGLSRGLSSFSSGVGSSLSTTPSGGSGSGFSGGGSGGGGGGGGGGSW